MNAHLPSPPRPARRCFSPVAMSVFIFTVLLAISSPPLKADTISTTVADFGSGGDVGQYTSQAVVAGTPAVAYYDATENRLRFARNSAADGSGTWTITTVDGSLTDLVGRWAALAIVNGNPAISYYDETNSALKFARNSAADGSGIWNITTVDSSGVVGAYTSLAVANGNPAISYSDETNGNLKFARNAAADGSGAWNVITVDNSANVVGKHTSLAILGGNGNPAISYYDDTANVLKFVRAQNTSGTAWFAPVTVDPGTGGFDVGQYTSLTNLFTAVPAIAYYDATNGDLKFARNSATDGSGSWTLVTVESSGNIGGYASLSIVGSFPNIFPVISYFDVTNGNLKFARSTNTAGNAGTWTAITTVDSSPDNVGQDTSLAIVNGTPAISYYDFTNGNLKFARSSANTGAAGTWTSPSPAIVDSGNQSGIVGQYTSQAILNGNPAISYFDRINDELKFARNSAADGSGVWAINTTGLEGPRSSLVAANGHPALSYTDGIFLNFARAPAPDGSGVWNNAALANSGTRFSSLAIINGNPAIGFFKIGGANPVEFLRAPNADGSGIWNDAGIASIFFSQHHQISLATVNGNPAVSYLDGVDGDLYFARSSNVNGDVGTWTFTTVDTTGYVGRFPSLVTVNGKPAICYVDNTGFPMVKFARSSDINGAPGTWTSTNVTAGESPSMAVVNGVPAIAFYDAVQKDLVFAINNAADGSGSWTKRTVDSAGFVGTDASLIVLANGKPAVSYYDETHGDLKWAMLSFSEIVVLQQPGGTEVADGGGSSMTAALGFPRDLSFTIRNYGIENLTGLVVTKDGTNASDFTVTVDPVAPVSGPLGSTSMTVRFHPTTAGTKTAAIHISSNDADESSFDINLTGTALSFSQDTDGDGVNDGTEFQLADLNFNWQVGQTALVNTLFSNLSGALPNLNTVGFYTQSQIQALHVGTPLLTKNPGTGQFKLTIAVQKSLDLIDFDPFPFTAPGVTINGQGEIEFQFGVPDNAAFFLLESH